MAEEYKQQLTDSFMNLSKIFNDIGEKDPYYSVLSDPKFMTKNLNPERLSQFHESGRSNVAFLFDTLSACSLDIDCGEALDFGCGVGRVTLPLTDRFSSVTACDISESNLNEARRNAEQQGISNVCFLKNEVDLVQQLGADRFNLIYSMIVLQHMIPPLMKIYISQFFKMLKPGGVAFFQLPTVGRDYQFNVGKLQESIQSQTVQIHALAFKEVFELINAEACRIVDLIELDCVGPGWDSYVFVVAKT